MSLSIFGKDYFDICKAYFVERYFLSIISVGITKCEICSKLTIKTPERPQGRHSGVFIFNFQQISLFQCVHC